MATLSKRKALPMVLLSMTVPICLLVTFRLTGVLREPPAPETITINEVRWQMERPSKYTRIKENVENAYTDYVISINASVSIHTYYENDLADPYWKRDGIAFQVNINATTLEGFIGSIVVEFFPSDVNSTMYFSPTFSRYHNVILRRIEGVSTSTGVTYIEAKASGSPCSMRLPSYWVFTDQNLENHLLRVNVEVTYFNGTTYRKIVAPIILEVLITSTQGSEG